jgi:methylenetetrahydrofolate--tRNA-(uracil-5-)-methyltransferase
MSAGEQVTVVGAGLAGCEAAWQLAERGVPVVLVEMKPLHRSPAHYEDGMAELVCSNSLRGASTSNAVGLLKEELRRLGSLLMRCADATAVAAGRALAVDRRAFSRAVESAIANHPAIRVVRRRQQGLPADGAAIVASGPLTDGLLAEDLSRRGAILAYHDAIAPLLAADGIDRSIVFAADRHEPPNPENEPAYLNCPFDEKGYRRFVAELIAADKTPLRDFERAPFFEGCLPVEEMAARGPLTLAHGPLKPIGLLDPRSEKRPFAVAQLRPEDAARSAYNLVGFQTRLTRPEQRRVLRTIPGLERASFERYGQVHRNSFVCAPETLDDRMRLRGAPGVRLAGQLTGVEGYVESIASGWLAGLLAAAEASGETIEPPPAETAIGGLYRHTRRGAGSYQPSNVVWSMIETERRRRGEKKREHRARAARRALERLEEWIAGCLAPSER